jgi:chemotaxis protein methyltransferase CheR
MPITRSKTVNPGTMQPATFATLQHWIRAESGIVGDPNQQYLLERRLLPLLASPQFVAEGIDTLEALGQHVTTRSGGAIAASVLDAVTTNETFFFRDTPMFEALRRFVLPAMLEPLRGRRKLRVWSAAASSGQEAYSVAIQLRELGKDATDCEIVGTDLSNAMLERARKARYAELETSRGLPREYLSRYFSRDGADWVLHHEVRAMVHFEQIDLRRNIGRLGHFDLILCRNVLIYFDVETKRQIVQNLEPMLSPAGVLVLGCAETILGLSETLAAATLGKSTFYRAAKTKQSASESVDG